MGSSSKLIYFMYKKNEENECKEPSCGSGCCMSLLQCHSQLRLVEPHAQRLQLRRFLAGQRRLKTTSLGPVFEQTTRGRLTASNGSTNSTFQRACASDSMRRALCMCADLSSVVFTSIDRNTNDAIIFLFLQTLQKQTSALVSLIIGASMGSWRSAWFWAQ
jgi:hypothetical protein